MIALCALGLAATGARGEVQFQSRSDFDLGSSPTAFAVAGADPAVLLVTTADGIAAYRREEGQLVRSARPRIGRGAQLLAAGPLGREGAPQIAYGGRGAARIEVADVGAQGELGEPEAVELPALPKLARIAPLTAAGGAALFVVTDDGLSVLMRGDSSWQRHDVGAPRFVSDVAVGDVTGDGRNDLLVADQTLNQLRLYRGVGDGSFEAAASVETLRAPGRLLLADLDRDGHPDVLVAGEDGLAYQSAQPDGHFAPPQFIWTVPHLADLALADLTGDGRLDLVVVNRHRAALSVLIGGGGGNFTLGESYLVGAGPQAVQLADVTGDGRLDALTLNQLADSATLLRGRGDGRFDGMGCLIGALGDLTALMVDDFDRDDHPDLAVASEDGGRIGVFLGRGDGGFRALPPIAVGRQPRALTSGDFNQDEIPDLAVVNFGSDAVAILDGDGRGGFASPRAIRVGTGPSAIGIGSFASPTSVDLAVVNSLSDSVSVLYGDGRGQFPTVTNYPVAARPSFLIIGDTNRDGNQDLVVGSELSESVSIMLGTGSQLDAPTKNTLSATAKPSLAGDLDGDDEMELINPDQTRGVVEILPGVGPGKFGLPITVPVGRDPHAVAAADFNHDGRIDIAVAHQATQTIAILINRSPHAEIPERGGQHAAARATR